MKSSMRNKERAQQLRTQMEDAGIISTDSTHEQIMGNTTLQRLLKTKLSLRLSKDPKDSVFSKLISDFDMFTNCNTDAKMNSFLKARKLKVSSSQLPLLIQKAKGLVAKVTTTKNNMIDDMEFDGTPDRTSRKKQKTALEMQQQLKEDEATCQDATNDANKKRGFEDESQEDNEGEEGDEDVEEEGMTEVSSSSSSSSSSVKTCSKKVTEKIIEVFPEIVDGAMLQLVDGVLMLVI